MAKLIMAISKAKISFPNLKSLKYKIELKHKKAVIFQVDW